MKNKLLKTISLVVSACLLIGILMAVFYWYSYRPYEVRKNCSWVKNTSGGYDEPDYSNIKTSVIDSVLHSEKVENAWQVAGKPTKHIPTSTRWVKTTSAEYSQCLRENGI